MWISIISVVERKQCVYRQSEDTEENTKKCVLVFRKLKFANQQNYNYHYCYYATKIFTYPI